MHWWGFNLSGWVWLYLVGGGFLGWEVFFYMDFHMLENLTLYGGVALLDHLLPMEPKSVIQALR
jgi:hypothetical protein